MPEGASPLPPPPAPATASNPGGGAPSGGGTPPTGPPGTAAVAPGAIAVANPTLFVSEGQLLAARVLATNGSRIELAIAGGRLSAESSLPLTAGESLRLVVAEASPQRVVLREAPGAAPGTAQPTALTQAGLPPATARALLVASAELGLAPRSPAEASTLGNRAVAAGVGTPAEAAAFVRLAARGLPTSPGSVAGLASLVEGAPLGRALAAVLSLAGQAGSASSTAPATPPGQGAPTAPATPGPSAPLPAALPTALPPPGPMPSPAPAPIATALPSGAPATASAPLPQAPPLPPSATGLPTTPPPATSTTQTAPAASAAPTSPTAPTAPATTTTPTTPTAPAAAALQAAVLDTQPTRSGAAPSLPPLDQLVEALRTATRAVAERAVSGGAEDARRAIGDLGVATGAREPGARDLDGPSVRALLLAIASHPAADATLARVAVAVADSIGAQTLAAPSLPVAIQDSGPGAYLQLPMPDGGTAEVRVAPDGGEDGEGDGQRPRRVAFLLHLSALGTIMIDAATGRDGVDAVVRVAVPDAQRFAASRAEKLERGLRDAGAGSAKVTVEQLGREASVGLLPPPPASGVDLSA